MHSRDSLRPECKACSQKQDRQRLADNRDAINKRRRERRAENADKINARERRWRAENPDRVRTIRRRRYLKHGDKIRQNSRRYYAENTDKARESRQRYYERNRDLQLEYHRQYREANREWRLEKKRLYYAANREADLARSRNYRENHLENIRHYHRLYRAQNADKITDWVGRRKERKRALPHTLTLMEWENALAYWDGKCAYCGITPEELTMDHYVPLRHPDCSGTVVSNVLPACRSCNSSKKYADAFHWMVRMFGLEKAEATHTRILQYFSLLSQVK